MAPSNTTRSTRSRWRHSMYYIAQVDRRSGMPQTSGLNEAACAGATPPSGVTIGHRAGGTP